MFYAFLYCILFHFFSFHMLVDDIIFNVQNSSNSSHISMFTLFQFSLIKCPTASKYCIGVFLPVIYIFISLPAPVRKGSNPERVFRCHYTKSNPIDNHSNISSKKLQKQNFKPLGHYTLELVQCHL